MSVDHNRSRGRRGFTLIELMVAIVVSGIVLLGIFAFSSIQQGTAVIHRRHVRVQQALEGAMHTIARDIRIAGLGVTRQCTELRIWDAAGNRLINPGAVDSGDVGTAVTDVFTKEPYWVLRDGIQAHWRSNDAAVESIEGSELTSASLTSAADSFDIIAGERNMTASAGVFTVSSVPTTSDAGAAIRFSTETTVLDPGTPQHVSWVQQLLPPGSFVLLTKTASENSQRYRVQNQGQCVLLQVTGDVGTDAGEWTLPIGNVSDFNKNLGELFDATKPSDAAGGGGAMDWNPNDLLGGGSVVPLGTFRWSRYEIDYSIDSNPYLVRSDIIGWEEGDDTINPGVDYPSCPGGECRLPKLRLPTVDGEAPPAVLVGPMVEDMQVAVGCDGYTDASAAALGIPAPDVTFAEKGGKVGAADDDQANRRIDEWDQVDDRGNDEWLGNAVEEEWAPDCVFYGTGERAKAQWLASGPASESSWVGPGFRMSPQVIRVTLLAKSETMASGAGVMSDDFYNRLFAIEDRPEMATFVGAREYLTKTERFAPKNLRWRNPEMR